MNIKLVWHDPNLHARQNLHRGEGARGCRPPCTRAKGVLSPATPSPPAPGRPPSRDASLHGPVRRLPPYQGMRAGWNGPCLAHWTTSVTGPVNLPGSAIITV